MEFLTPDKKRRLLQTPELKSTRPSHSPMPNHVFSKFAPHSTVIEKQLQLPKLLDPKSISNRTRCYTPQTSFNKEKTAEHLKAADFEVMKVIGAGCYGTVKLGMHVKERKAVALKTIEKDYAIKMGQEKNLYAEKLFLSELKHVYIPKYYGSFQSKDHIYFVSEFINGGGIMSAIK